MNRTILKASRRKRVQTNNILIISGLGVYAAYLFIYSGFYHDDAFISLRYALNWQNGHGIVWNPGEYIEGYTNFLWVISSALLSSLPGVTLVIATKVMGCAACLGTLIFMGRYKGGKYIYASLLLATNGCYALWSTGGLASSAFASLGGICTILALEYSPEKKSVRRLGLLLASLSMLRPEGLLFFVLIFLYVMCVVKDRKGAKTIAKAFILVYAPYYLWRYVYYGYSLLPNTYYAKSGFDIINLKSGLRYLQHFLEAFGFPLAVFIFVTNIRKFIRNNILTFSILAAYLLHVIHVGGDHMPGYRFMVHVMPVMYIFVAEGFQNLEINKKQRKTLKLFILILNIAASLGITSMSLHIKGNFISNKKLLSLEDRNTRRTRILYDELTMFEDPASFYGSIYGRYMAENWPKNSLVALNTAGSTPFYSGLRSIDMLGLSDGVIAKGPMPKRRLKWQYIPGHVRGNGSYVLSRKPDYIIAGSAMGSSSAWFLSDLELLENRSFYDAYSYNVVLIESKHRSKLRKYAELGVPGNIFFKLSEMLYKNIEGIEDFPKPYISEIPDYLLLRYFAKRDR